MRKKHFWKKKFRKWKRQASSSLTWSVRASKCSTSKRKTSWVRPSRIPMAASILARMMTWLRLANTKALVQSHSFRIWKASLVHKFFKKTNMHKNSNYSRLRNPKHLKMKLIWSKMRLSKVVPTLTLKRNPRSKEQLKLFNWQDRQVTLAWVRLEKLRRA